MDNRSLDNHSVARVHRVPLRGLLSTRDVSLLLLCKVTIRSQYRCLYIFWLTRDTMLLFYCEAAADSIQLFQSLSSLSVSVSSGDGVRSWGCTCVVGVSDATGFVLLRGLSVCSRGAAAPPPQLFCLLPEDDFRVGLILLVVSSSFGGSPLSWRDKVCVTLFIRARLPMVPPNVLIGFGLGTVM